MIRPGLILDGNNSSKPEGATVFTMNMVMDELQQSLKNEDGFNRIYEADTIDNFTLTGVISTPDKLICFATYSKIADSNEYSTIFVIDETATGYTFEIIITTFDAHIHDEYVGFHFSINNPIQGTYTYNAKKELIVSFIEGVRSDANPMRMINIDNIGIELDMNKFPITPEDIYYFNSNKPLDIPDINLTKVNNGGGSLKNGEYYVFAAYTDDYNNRTNYLSYLNPITIYKETTEQEYIEVFDTLDYDVTTSKSIELNINNLSSYYTSLMIGVIYKTNGSLFAYTRKVDYSGTSLKYVIRQLALFNETSIDNVLIDNLIYEKVNAITKLNNELIIGNLTTHEKVDYQQYANQITTTYQVVEANTYLEERYAGSTVLFDFDKTFKSNQMIVNNKTFQPNEVYALYIELIFNDGTTSDIFTIPGREMIANSYLLPDGTTYVNEDAILVNGGGTSSTQVDITEFPEFAEDFELGSEVKIFQIRDTADKGSTLAFWENETEVYPDDPSFGTLAGQPVRHHKMPTFINYRDKTVNYVFQPALHIKLDNITFPTEIQNQIQGYRIYIAERNNDNNLVVDEGMMHHLIQNYNFNSHYRPSGALPLVFTSAASYTTGVTSGARAKEMHTNNLTDKFIIYAPKTQMHNNPLSYDYIKFENIYKELSESITIDDPANPGTSVIVDIIHNDGAFIMNFSNNILNFQDATDSYYLKYLVNSPNNRVKDSYYGYIDTIINNVDMTDSSSGIIVETYNTDIMLSSDLIDPNISNTVTFARTGTQNPTAVYEGYKHNVNYKVLFCNYNTDLYNSYNKQNLILVTENIGLDNNISIQGDSIVSSVAIKTTAKYDFENASPNWYFTINTLHFLPYVSTENFELRTPGDLVQDYNYRGNIANFVTTANFPIQDNFFNKDYLNFAQVSGTWYDLYDDSNINYVEYPTVDWSYIGQDARIDNFWGGIKHDWASVSNLKPKIIFSPYNNFVTDFPYRIAKSLPQTTESLINNWFIFKPENYQEMDNSKGEVMTLDAMDKILYVRQRYSTYAYQIKDALTALSQQISLESNDIFHNSPTEIITDEDGYVGSNGRFESLVTPYGYYVIDVVRNGVWKIAGVTPKDLTMGHKVFIEQRFNSELNNPFLANLGGYHLGYNDKDKMVLLTCIDTRSNSNKSFTISYGIFKDNSISFHQYVPTIYTNTRRNLFSIANTGIVSVFNYKDVNYKFGIYQHNARNKKCKYYIETGETEQSIHKNFVDVVFNTLEGKGMMQNKILNFIEWFTETNFVDYTTNTKLARPNITISELAVYSDTQCTGILPVNSDNLDWYEVQTGRNIQNRWVFNNIFDSVRDVNEVILDANYNINNNNIILKDFWELSNFIGTFVVVRLIYNNNIDTITNNQLEQIITIANVNFTIDNR